MRPKTKYLVQVFQVWGKVQYCYVKIGRLSARPFVPWDHLLYWLCIYSSGEKPRVDNNGDFNQGRLHLWSKFGVLELVTSFRSDKLVIATNRHERTKMASGKNDKEALFQVWASKTNKFRGCIFYTLRQK